MLFIKQNYPVRPNIPDLLIPEEPLLKSSDIKLDERGDLLVSSLGDIATVSQEESIAISLLRRVLTPPGGYARFFRFGLEVTYLGQDLENIVYNYLSSGNILEASREIEIVLTKLAQLDNRLEVISVKLKPTGLTNINIDLHYRIIGSTESRTLIYRFR